jgi:hypothetical protein
MLSTLRPEVCRGVPSGFRRQSTCLTLRGRALWRQIFDHGYHLDNIRSRGAWSGRSAPSAVHILIDTS